MRMDSSPDDHKSVPRLSNLEVVQSFRRLSTLSFNHGSSTNMLGLGSDLVDSASIAGGDGRQGLDVSRSISWFLPPIVELNRSELRRLASMESFVGALDAVIAASHNNDDLEVPPAPPAPPVAPHPSPKPVPPKPASGPRGPKPGVVPLTKKGRVKEAPGGLGPGRPRKRKKSEKSAAAAGADGENVNDEDDDGSTEPDDVEDHVRLQLALETMNKQASIRLAKQTCHFCGVKAPLENRVVCKNSFCALGGVSPKYICRKCIDEQRVYCEQHGCDFDEVFGDVESPTWFCPCCLVVSISKPDGSEFTTLMGLCCCSLRRLSHFCILHPDDTDDAGRRIHCCPYRQKIGARKQEAMKILPIDIKRIRMGDQPFVRLYTPANMAAVGSSSSSSSSSSSAASGSGVGGDESKGNASATGASSSAPPATAPATAPAAPAPAAMPATMPPSAQQEPIRALPAVMQQPMPFRPPNVGILMSGRRAQAPPPFGAPAMAPLTVAPAPAAAPAPQMLPMAPAFVRAPTLPLHVEADVPMFQREMTMSWALKRFSNSDSSDKLASLLFPDVASSNSENPAPPPPPPPPPPQQQQQQEEDEDAEMDASKNKRKR